MRISLSKARSGAEFANTGYVIFAFALIATSALLEWQAKSAPGLHVIYEGLQGVFAVILEEVHLDKLPHANSPLTFSALLITAGILPLKKTRTAVGMAAADAALTFLDYLVRSEEWLIRHRTFSSVLLLVLVTVFGNGVYSLLATKAAAERATTAYKQWLALLRSTVLDTTMVAGDADKYRIPLAFWSQSALGAFDKDSPRIKYGLQVNALIDGIYVAIAQNTNLCVDIDAVIRSSPVWSEQETDRDDFVRSLASLHALVRARGFEKMLSEDCPLPEVHLKQAKDALDRVEGTELEAARLNLLGLIYSYAWRVWLKQNAVSADLAQVCQCPEDCISKGYRAHTRLPSGVKDEYQEIKRRNNAVDFLIHLAEGDLTKVNVASIHWLLKLSHLPGILEKHVGDLEKGAELHRLGAYIPYHTLAQGYAVLALQGPAERRATFEGRAIAYVDISSALSPSATFQKLGPSICKLAKSPELSKKFRAALVEPIDRWAAFQDAVRECP